MTPAKPFPPELSDWVAGHLPGLDANEDRSWPRSTSLVWRVSAAGRNAYVKISPSDLEFEREVAGYSFTAAHLSETQAPRLLACDPGLRAILSTPLPGRVVRDLPLEAGIELRLYEAAGRLLRHWHDASEPGTAADRAAVRSDMEDKAREAADCLEDVAPYLAADRLALVEAASQELPGLDYTNDTGTSRSTTCPTGCLLFYRGGPTTHGKPKLVGLSGWDTVITNLF
ncbi:phosphotransferase [Streptomyces sp. NPDC046988]|uniref:phosphotransferase n=1 Tax=Streptomyces sp. NPDC046988 TaxID=3154922 RepID=UPI0033E4C84C